MNQEVTTTPGNAVSTDLTASWGGQAVEARDILLPRIFVLQKMSELVDEGDHKPGQIIRSTDHVVVADQVEAMTFIPLTFTKKWQVSDMTTGQPQFLRFENYTHENADLPWNWEEGGSRFRRDTVIDFYCLLKDDIDSERAALKAMEESGELPDPDDAMFPVCISFKRTSYAAGKTLLTHFAKADSFKVTPAVKMFGLTAKKVTNEHATYYVLDVKPQEKTAKEDLPSCKRWFDIITQANVKVDIEPEEAPTQQRAATAPKSEEKAKRTARTDVPPPIEDIPF